MSSTFKILSLDGGGIRGLYLATVLRKFEEQLAHPIGEYFDMICGTSTGGLIALALSKRIPAVEIENFYIEYGPSIFPAKRFMNQPRGFLRQLFGRGKYDNLALEESLKGILKDTKMSEAQNLLCVPSFNLTAGRPRVFKYPHPEGKNQLEKYGRMIDAALATSAAPTYFPVKYKDNCYYADGGVWANNPTLCGLMEALEFFIGDGKRLLGPNEGLTFGDYAILSLACLPEQNGWAHTGEEKDLKLSFRNWRDKLFNTSIDGQSHFADNFARKLIKETRAPGKYVRIQGPRSISPAQQSLLALDNTSLASLQSLQRFGEDVGDHYTSREKDEIDFFFEHKKAYTTIAGGQ